MPVALWLAVLLAKKKLLHTTIVVDSRWSTHARMGEIGEITCRRVVCTCPPFSHSAPEPLYIIRPGCRPRGHKLHGTIHR